MPLVKQTVQKAENISMWSDCKTMSKREQTHHGCLHTVQKHEKVESISTQNDYETMS